MFSALSHVCVSHRTPFSVSSQKGMAWPLSSLRRCGYLFEDRAEPVELRPVDRVGRVHSRLGYLRRAADSRGPINKDEIRGGVPILCLRFPANTTTIANATRR